MKKLLTLVFAMLLSTSLAFAQAGGGTGTADNSKKQAKTVDASKKTKKEKKAKKASKKDKKGKTANAGGQPPK